MIGIKLYSIQLVKQLFYIMSKYIGIRISDELEEALINISKNTKKLNLFT
jgi:plasmid replication initiation protein